jgi:hypothetical protein
MKLTLGMAIVVAGISFAGTAAAQAHQDFTLVNKTGYTIDQVYVAPSSSDDWEEDVLGQDQLTNGDNVHITFSRDAKPCGWDLKVVYTDGEKAEWEKFDLCQVSKITINYDRSSGRTWAEYE